MNISAPFIRRPVATSLLTVGLARSGILAWGLLPVSPLPQVDFPTIQVSASLPGAEPDTMATSVAAPLERQFGRIAGLTEMTSTSYLGSTSVALQFDLSRNIDGAVRDVQAAEITSNDQLLRAAGYAPVIIAYRGGRPVQLADVARVEDSVEDVRTTGLANGRPAVLLVIFRQPGANIIETVDGVRRLLPDLQAAIPRAITMSVVMDQTQTIRASLHDVERTLVISVLLVTLVVFAFLRSPRATLIPAVAVPVSLVGTFGVMYVLGYSLDNLSLMALTIATGFVVDDAIVVLENVARHRAAGLSPLEAALRGAREIGFTVLAISLSLVAVFTPILLMGGLVGRLFREFAVTLSAAIAISLLVSLTTTPMMCATLLAQETDGDHGRLYRASEGAFEWMRRCYETSLAWVLRHPRGVLAVTLLTVAVNGYLFWVVPKGFFPQQDTGRLQGAIQAAQDISFQAMEAKLTEIVDIVGHDPAVANGAGFTGAQGSGPRTPPNP